MGIYTPSYVGNLRFSNNFTGLDRSPRGASGTFRTTLGYNPPSDRVAVNAQSIISDDTLPTIGDPMAIDRTAGGSALLLRARRNTGSTPAPYSAQPWYNGFISTLDSFAILYAYFEVVLSMGRGKGLWPAFPLYSANNRSITEIDGFEQYGTALAPGQLSMSAHWRPSNIPDQFVNQKPNLGTLLKFDGTPLGVDPTQLNTYAIEWTPQAIMMRVNGEVVAAFATPPQLCVPMFLSLGVGVAASGLSFIDGPDLTTPDGLMTVDSINIWDLPSTVIVTGRSALAPASGGLPPMFL